MGTTRMLGRGGDSPPVYTYEAVPGVPPVSVARLGRGSPGGSAAGTPDGRTDKPLAVLARPGAAFERVALIRNWSRDLALLTDGEGGLSEADRKKLDALSVPVYEERISRLEGDPARPGGGLGRIVFEGGSALKREGMFYVPPQRQRSGLAGSLGCELSAPVPTVEFVKADPMKRETTVAGVYSVGDAVAGPGQSVVLASASGAAAAYVLNHALAKQDAEDEVAAATPVQSDLGRAAG